MLRYYCHLKVPAFPALQGTHTPNLSPKDLDKGGIEHGITLGTGREFGDDCHLDQSGIAGLFERPRLISTLETLVS